MFTALLELFLGCPGSISRNRSCHFTTYRSSRSTFVQALAGFLLAKFGLRFAITLLALIEGFELFNLGIFAQMFFFLCCLAFPTFVDAISAQRPCLLSVDNSRAKYSYPPTDHCFSLSKNTTSCPKRSKANKATVRKINAILSHRGGESVCGKESLKPQNLVKKRDDPALIAPYAMEGFPAKKESLAMNLELNATHHGTYLDPMAVQQWMTNSVTELGPLSEISSYGLYNAMPGNDTSVVHLAQGTQGSLSVLRSVTSPISLPESTFVSDAERLPASCDKTCEPILALGKHPPLGFSADPDFSNVVPMGEQHHTVWSYPTPRDDSFLFSNQAFVQSANAMNDLGLHHEWMSESFQAEADFYSGTTPCDSQPMVWPPISAVDSSVASSYSHHSTLGHLPNSPLSPDIQEDAVQCANLDDGVEFYPGLNIGEAMPFTCSMDGADSQIKASALESGRDFQSTATPTLDSWSQGDIPSNSSYMTAPFITRRRLSEGETTTAREHRYYQVGPGADGLYHCPYAAAEGCTHKPEKLKCNYDKHLDSHLKPYRCKASSCVSVTFSSSACMLRHEREAHGMHGHGENLCYFPACERSQPGNGFRRRWNLGDHMKRMHNYTGPAFSAGSSSPTPSSTSSLYHGIPSKRRRPSNASQGEGTKRTKPKSSTRPSSKSAKTIAPASSHRKQRQTMDKMFHEKKAALALGLENLDPKDIRASEQLYADCAVLQTIGMTIRRQEASEFAR